MAAPLVSDALWAIIEPLIPPEPPKPKGGRPRLDDRAALTGILFVLRTGIPWELLPVEMGCGSGMTCWRRLHEWHRAGVWERLHRVLLDRLGYGNAINWDRAAVDSASVPAKSNRVAKWRDMNRPCSGSRLTLARARPSGGGGLDPSARPVPLAWHTVGARRRPSAA